MTISHWPTTWLAQVVRVKLFLCHACHTISIYSQNNKPFRFRGASILLCLSFCIMFCGLFYTILQCVHCFFTCLHPLSNPFTTLFLLQCPFVIDWLHQFDTIDVVDFTTCDPSACIAPIRRSHIACTFGCRNYKLQDCFHWASLVAWIATTKSLLTLFSKLPSVYVCYLHVLCLHCELFDEICLILLLNHGHLLW
jgi:hypothetical protein